MLRNNIARVEKRKGMFDKILADGNKHTAHTA